MTTHDSKNPNRLELCEVGPRDGLQNESILVPLETKVAFIEDPSYFLVPGMLHEQGFEMVPVPVNPSGQGQGCDVA